MKRTARLAFIVGAVLFASAVSAAATEVRGPPQISQLEARPSGGHFELRATIAPGRLRTHWTINVERFQPCGPIREKPKREPKKVASGTLSSRKGAMQVDAHTPVSESGARTFVVVAANSDGEATSRHSIPQGECHAE